MKDTMNVAASPTYEQRQEQQVTINAANKAHADIIEVSPSDMTASSYRAVRASWSKGKIKIQEYLASCRLITDYAHATRPCVYCHASRIVMLEGKARTCPACDVNNVN